MVRVMAAIESASTVKRRMRVSFRETSFYPHFGHEVGRSARQHVDGAVMVQPTQVVERDADLQDALVEMADVAALGAPQQLERLVLLEELASIELRDGVEQQRRRRFVTAHGRVGLAGLVGYLKEDVRKAAIEDPWIGPLCHAEDSEEHAHHRLRGRENLEPGEPEARTPLYSQRPHLVLQADEPHRD